MNQIKSIFSWLNSFLEKARIIMLNIGTAIVLIFFIILIFGPITSIESEVKDPSGRVLFIDPVGTVVDQEVFSSDFLLEIATGSSTEQIQTRDLIQLIRAAGQDEDVPAVLVDFSSTSFAGPTTAINIAKELKSLRDSGKRVIAFNDRLSTTSYLMASQASEIWLHPVGSISIRGIGGVRAYQKELYENLKINFHNYSQGDFKSAVESNTRTNMSENDKMQRENLLNPIWDEMKFLMAQGRGIEINDLQSFADEYIGFFGEAEIGNIAYALEKNIIDGTKSFPEFRQYMIEEFGLDEEAKTETYKTISYNDYKKQINKDYSNSDNQIAVILVRSATQVRANIIDNCPSIKIIGRGGVGMDNIDVEYAKSKGINVINTPAASSKSVAELVFSHLFGCVRFLHESNRSMPLDGDSKFKDLKKSYAKGTELAGKTIGIIGFGRIGQEVAKIAIGVGMNVIFYDKFSQQADIKLDFFDGQNLTFKLNSSSFEEVLSNSDFITIHIPASDKYIIDSDEFKKMKEGSGILNLSRGGIINEEELIKNIESRKISFAAIDTFEDEPNPSVKVLMNSSISLTPHIGAATNEAQDRIGVELAEKINEILG